MGNIYIYSYANLQPELCWALGDTGPGQSLEQLHGSGFGSSYKKQSKTFGERLSQGSAKTQNISTDFGRHKDTPAWFRTASLEKHRSCIYLPLVLWPLQEHRPPRMDVSALSQNFISQRLNACSCTKSPMLLKFQSCRMHCHLKAQDFHPHQFTVNTHGHNA